MRKLLCINILAIFLCPFATAENMVSRVKKAVERSTLNEPGTKPFHLKATIAHSFERDKDSGRTGAVEVWWASPTEWRREVRSPEFHQVEIVNNGHEWQKNEGDYFPEWLRETAAELINPVPPLDEVLEHVKTAETRSMMNQVNVDWTTTTGTAEVKNIQRTWIALDGNTGLLLYGGGFGWGGEFKNYRKFNGKMIAQTIKVGSPEVTATVTTLEELGSVSASFFDTNPSAGDPQPLNTELIDEPTLRKNMLPMEPIVWPTLQDGSLEGNVTTWIVVDREGKVREMKTVVSENSGVNETGENAIRNLRFKPFLVNGVPVQAMSQITMPFKTTRPAGTETFESARNYFERGRKISFPAGTGTAYIMRAEFQFKPPGGSVVTGHYEDTWLSDEQWLRKAEFEKDQCARSRNGDTTYRITDGSSAGVLCLVLKTLEPIPAIDTFVESDWRIKRDTLNGVKTVRLATGHEDADGRLDPQARAYWFDDSGLLLQAYFNGVETRRSEFQDFNGIRISHQIDMLKDGHLAMKIRVTDVVPATTVSPEIFKLKGHEWQRAFTDEVR